MFTIGTAGGGLDASGSGALNFTNVGSYVLSGTNTARTLTLTGTNTGGNTLAGIIADNGTGATSLIKSGAGTWTLSGVNTYTGDTTVQAGTLLSPGGGIIYLRGNVYVGTPGGGPAATLGSNINNTYFNTANTSDATVYGNGTLYFVNAPGGHIRNLTITGGTATSAYGYVDGTITMTGGLLNGSGGIYGGNTSIVTNASAATATISVPFVAYTANFSVADGAAPIDLLVTAGKNNGAIALNKSGAGTMALSGAGTFTGATVITGGTLLLQNSLALQNSPLTYGGTGIVFDSSVATHAFTVGGLNGATNLALQDNASSPNAVALTVNAGGSASYSGILSGGGNVIKSGAGTQTLSAANTYVGATTINSGVLSVGTLANGGVASGIGASSNAAANLVLNGGALQYTGSVAASTDRLFTLGTTGGSTLDSSGTGSLTFANTATCVLSGSNTARTLTLTGSNAGSNTFAALLTDNGTGATSVVKSGSGTWILSGANTYTGGTTIAGGSLITTGAGSLGTGNLNMTGGSLTLGSAAAIATNATLVFNPAMGAGSINLNFTGTKAIAGLNNGTLYAMAGRYTAAQLNTFFGSSVFAGTGSFLVGTWAVVPLGGGGYVSGLVSDSSGADIYARTDVGGVFRWVPGTGGNGQWLSITDTIVPTNTTGSEGLMGTSAIAVDPNNANNLYVAVGSPSSALYGIYASTDRGATWAKINPSNAIVIDGNGPYRPCGERLAVDPNNSNIVWFGSTTSGLWKGVQSGGSWTWTQISASLVPFGALQIPYGSTTEPSSKAGVTFVACDANGGSTIVYVGVFNNLLSGSTGGVYKSVDGGGSWTPLTPPAGVTFTTPVRGQVSANGNLYVTSATVMNTTIAVPVVVNYGAVAKMARGGSALTDITPAAGINYRGLAIDPNDATGNTVYVAQAASSWCKIWRSTGGGAAGTWTTQYQNFNNSLAVARTEPDGTPALTGYWFGAVSALLVTPGNPDELWAGDYFGVARTQNAHLLGGTPVGSQSIWYMLQNNQEETVVEAIKNAPTGPELMRANADVGGFRYLDISQRPYGAYGSTFINPVGANNTSLDFCESDNNVWVRSWTGNTLMNASDYYGTGAYTKDGGVIWTSFGEIDRKAISSGAAGWETWDLTTYLAAQRAAGVTTVTLILSSGAATNNSGNILSFASKENATTTIRPYLLLNGSLSVSPSDDTMVDGSAPGTNYGGATTMGVSFAYGNTAYERHIYLKFDLSGVTSITSATLNLSRIAATAGITFPVGVYACSNTTYWSESTLIWTGKPVPYASSNGQPNYYDPHYVTPAGAYLSGGRVAVSSTNPNLLVWMPFSKNVAPNNVPHYSVDRGVTWTPCVGLPAGIMRLKGKSNPSYLIQQLAADRVNGQFYMAHLGASAGNPVVYRSTDGGITWTPGGTIPAGTNNIYRAQIVAAPAVGDVWYSDDGISGTTAGGLWRSTNGALNWGAGLANIRAVRQVAFGKAPAGSSSLYSVYFNGYYSGVKGVYRSDDYGATWTPLPDLPSDIGIESLAGDRQVPGSVFIGTGGRGVFQTQ